MDKKESFIDKNLLISFLISFFFLLFISIISLPPKNLQDSFSDKEKVTLETPYKLLYFVDKEVDYSKSVLIEELPLGTTEYKGESISPEFLSFAFSNTCEANFDFSNDKDSLTLQNIARKNTSSSFSLRDYEIEGSPESKGINSIKVYKAPEDENEVYTYDFVTKKRTKIDCTGYNEIFSTTGVSPDKRIVLSNSLFLYEPDYIEPSEINSNEIIFPYIGNYKKYTSTNEFIENNKILIINGNKKSAKEEGIILNPYLSNDEDDYMRDVQIIGWYK